MSVITINHKYQEAHDITMGDIFLVDGQYIQLVEIDSPEFKLGLLDVGDARMLSTSIKNIPHAINHVKKHYGEFELIPRSKVSVTIVESK